MSRLCDVVNGVPQGSVLGPLLFLLYINFLMHNISSRTKTFADDLKLYMTIKTNSLNDVWYNMASCQRDIARLHKVALSCGLSMNTNKCVVVKFQRRPMDLSGLPSMGMYYLNDINPS